MDYGIWLFDSKGIETRHGVVYTSIWSSLSFIVTSCSCPVHVHQSVNFVTQDEP